MIGRIMKWKGCGRKWSWPNLRFYLGIFQEELRKTMKNFSQDSQSLGQDLNLGHPEYKAGLLPTQL
jgi:hypothetical protein